VLVSSHLLSEVAQSVDDVVVIAHGVLRAEGPLASVLGSPDGALTRVRAADPGRLAGLLRDHGAAVERDESGALLVRSAPEVVGTVAAEYRVVLTELVAVSRSLEDAFFALTVDES
jgi:ABC-2 type transport system ATP-binding protein